MVTPDQTGRWGRFKELTKELPQLPIRALATFAAVMGAALGALTIVRAFEWIYENYLRESWVQ